jgi:hypothetical protein
MDFHPFLPRNRGGQFPHGIEDYSSYSVPPLPGGSSDHTKSPYNRMTMTMSCGLQAGLDPAIFGASLDPRAKPAGDDEGCSFYMILRSRNSAICAGA